MPPDQVRPTPTTRQQPTPLERTTWPLGSSRSPRRAERTSPSSKRTILPLDLAGLDHSTLSRRLWFDPTIRCNVDLITSAYGRPAWRRLAEARVAGTAAASDRATATAA